MSSSPQRVSRGFTLVEITISITILGLAVGVVAVAASNTGLAEMRRGSTMLAGTVRYLYDEAALTGQTHRLVFSPGKQVVKSEATDQILSFEEGSNALAESAERQRTGSLKEFLELPADLGIDLEGEDGGESGGLGIDVSAMTALLGMNSALGSGSSGSSSLASESFSEGREVNLPGKVRILDVWVEGMDKVQTEGDVYLYFFPHGYTQDAYIHLEDDDGRVSTVKVWALTGKTEVTPEYLEPEK